MFGPVYLSKAMAGELAALQAEIVWLTDWGDMANRSIAPWFGWGPLPVAESPAERAGRLPEGAWWKLDALRALQAKVPGPFIWADDHLRRYWPEAKRALPSLAEHGSPYLAICPKTDVGLTPAHLDGMRRFVEAARSAEGAWAARNGSLVGGPEVRARALSAQAKRMRHFLTAAHSAWGACGNRGAQAMRQEAAEAARAVVGSAGPGFDGLLERYVAGSAGHDEVVREVLRLRSYSRIGPEGYQGVIERSPSDRWRQVTASLPITQRPESGKNRGRLRNQRLRIWHMN